eukprot:TRINITY_DN45081_c0_g1_i1.p1 TRINITY_DN45081_c0_g1~~TRINITY_DN45081_c0_g1_i1.p1  ORF type:complete len:727 (-),score=328.83 TRINITY_DN45081_c0_g1_i1:78-2231(-)
MSHEVEDLSPEAVAALDSVLRKQARRRSRSRRRSSASRSEAVAEIRRAVSANELLPPAPSERDMDEVFALHESDCSCHSSSADEGDSDSGDDGDDAAVAEDVANKKKQQNKRKKRETCASRRWRRQQACNKSLSGRFFKLLHYHHVPQWYQDNEFIHRGYRVDLGWKNAFRSLCHIHNETVNVWTHLVAFVLIFILLLFTLLTLSPYGIDRIAALKQSAVQLGRDGPAIGRLGGIGAGVDGHHNATTLTTPLAFGATQLGYAWASAARALGLDSSIPSHLHSSSSSSSVSSSHDSTASSSSSDDHMLDTSASSTMTTSDDQRSFQMQSDASRAHHFFHQDNANGGQCHESGDEVTVWDLNSVHHGFAAYGRHSVIDSPLIEHVSTSAHKRIDRRRLHVNFHRMYESVKSHVPSLEGMVGSLHQYYDDHKGMKDAIGRVQQRLEGFKSTLDKVRLQAGDSLSQLEQRRLALLESLDEFAASSQATTSAAFHDLSVAVQKMGDGISFMRFLSPYEAEHDVFVYLPRWPLAIYMLSAMICLFSSALFHLFVAVSQQVGQKFQQLDYAGISLLIGGSQVPVIYYGFFCQPAVRTFYLATIAVTTAAGFTVTMMPTFSKPEYRPFRAGLFITVSLWGLVPVSHIWWDNGLLDVIQSLGLMGVLYLSGAAIYASRFPERCSPGTFDTCGASHQIWHCFIVMAIVTLYLGTVDFYEWRMGNVCH